MTETQSTIKPLGYDEDMIGAQIYGSSTEMYKEFIMAGGGSHWWHYRCYYKPKESDGYCNVWDGNTIINKDGDHHCGDLYIRTDGHIQYLKEISNEEELKEANEEVRKMYMEEYEEKDYESMIDNDDYYFKPFAVKGEECYFYNSWIKWNW